MKMFLSLIVLLVLGMSTSLAQSPPCPPPDFDVEPQCQPAPAWVSKTEVIQLGPACWAEIEYCVQWVCRGHAGLSRSRISITRIRVWDANSGNGAPPLCPTDNSDILDPSDPNFVAEYHAYIQKLVHHLIIQGIALHDGPPAPCSPTNTDFLTEIITTGCVTAGAWEGKVKYNTGVGPTPVWQDAFGMTLNYCSGEGGCTVLYHTCLQNGVPVTTEVGRTVDPLISCPASGGYTGYPTGGSFTPVRPVVGDAQLTNPGMTVEIRNDTWNALPGPTCIPICNN